MKSVSLPPGTLGTTRELRESHFFVKVAVAGESEIEILSTAPVPGEEGAVEYEVKVRLDDRRVEVVYVLVSERDGRYFVYAIS